MFNEKKMKINLITIVTDGNLEVENSKEITYFTFYKCLKPLNTDSMLFNILNIGDLSDSFLVLGNK